MRTIEEVCYELKHSCVGREEIDNFADEIIEIHNMERKTGKWVRVDEKPYFRKHFHKVCCSNCNEEGYEKWNYCPNCGQRCKR